jgi:hypothetical protein
MPNIFESLVKDLETGLKNFLLGLLGSNPEAEIAAAVEAIAKSAVQTIMTSAQLAEAKAGVTAVQDVMASLAAAEPGSEPIKIIESVMLALSAVFGAQATATLASVHIESVKPIVAAIPDAVKPASVPEPVTTCSGGALSPGNAAVTEDYSPQMDGFMGFPKGI